MVFITAVACAVLCVKLGKTPSWERRVCTPAKLLELASYGARRLQEGCALDIGVQYRASLISLNKPSQFLERK